MREADRSPAAEDEGQSHNPKSFVVFAFIAALLLAMTLTWFLGVPDPCAHDEFSYLLGADTFASGRLTNPTHPLWQNFESFHVIHQPSYASKYPPAQALALSVGQRLGHPIIGSWLTTATAIAALVWMLTAWLPRRWWWLAVAFSVFHPGFQLVWGQSYWGGAIAMTGAALLVGAYGRLTKRMEWKYAVAAGVGTLLLANSRPFEGALLTATVGLALLWKLHRNADWHVVPFLRRVIAPGLGVLLVGFAAMLLYNRAVTGHPTKMAYQVHEDEYGWNPLFLWQTPGEPPPYRHEMMERFHRGDKTVTETVFKSPLDVLRIKWGAAWEQTRFFCSDARLIAMLGLPFLLTKPRYRELLLLMLPVYIAALATPWIFPHYFAPAAPMLLVLFLASLMEIWTRFSDGFTARRIMLGVGLVLFLFSTHKLYAEFANPVHRDFAAQRAEIARLLESDPGRDLVLVRYADHHNPCHEWVYNQADIDAAEVVWAREPETNGEANSNEMLKYFADRKVWVVHADAKHPYLQRFATP